MKTRFSLALAATLAVVAGGACLDDDVTGVREADIRLVVTSDAVSAGETVQVTYQAQGTGIVQVLLEWGDGQVDTTNFSGPVEVAGDREHVYVTEGTYVLVGTVLALDAFARDSVTMTVSPP